MCNVLDDYLKTYNPDVTEFHTDSSDFEGTNSSMFTERMARHKPPMKTLYPNRKCHTQANPVTENSSKETWGSVTTCISPNGSTIDIKLQKSYKNKKYKIFDGGDHIETIKSKRSVIRHKVIPCLSNVFGRSNSNVKQMSIIKENPAEHANTENGCQTTRVNRDHKMRKFDRRQHYYTAQPVYAVEGKIHAKSPPFQHTKFTRKPLTTCKAVGNGNFENICSLTSSSEEVETHRFFKRKRGKRNKPKHHIVESDMGKEYFERYEGQGMKHIEQQYPAKLSPVPPYQEHPGPDQCQQQHKNAGCAPMSGSLNASGLEIGIACSGFWEYIVNKINMKMQPQIKKKETTTNTPPFKPCTCIGNQAESTSENCCCPNCDAKPKRSHKKDGLPPPPPPPPPPMGIKLEARTSSSSSDDMKDKKKKKKVICKCPLVKDAKVGRSYPKEKTRPCQIDHDEVTDSLCNKYNGEILCIHNPPCILINGCLTIPPPPREEQCTSYSLMNEPADKKCSYEDMQTKGIMQPESHCYHEDQQCQNFDACCQCLTQPMEFKPRYNKMKNESCQYQIPQLLKHLMATNYGIHYHSPPLEVRRQQTDDESHSEETHKHQATDIENYKYWLAPNEVRRQEMASPDSYQYRQSSLPNETKKLSLTSDDSREKLRQNIEVKQIKTKQQKQEKIVQSICPHNPPCEVVRTCCKSKIDPKLQNSCVHVPMCENVPLCLMELKNQCKNISNCECPHKPKCTEVPVCTRNYIVLTAKEEVATQVRPKTKMVCRHVPPCIMIPTCLAHVCDSCIPYDAIPDCIHQPMCDMIPACCRKSAKEMVSFRSQYPSQCCIA